MAVYTQFCCMKEISVCIVDDNRDLRNALEEIISMSEGYECVATIGTAEEAIRVVKAMPNWKAGKQNGNAVPVYFNLPVTFKLSAE